ncbi:TadE/TadG family type IV pilus assembly protein [Cellulomonas sp.]|uniref:TadE/TadG family type IV pilus assembly protein n=1 Tax=Cellulomonas sp. TaxID=40001 RepID=UPI002585F6D9|nr:TadE/TadG family type IV pilus assembly protein [Cellulomonas sp.]MCR6689429.1 pilus assembly protein [Cellulomonas sp.]
MVDFVLVGGLVVVLVLGIVQLALALHVRNVLVDSASEGARYGALLGRTPADGAQRTRELVTGALSASYASDVTSTRVVRDGVTLVEVTVTAPLPVVGLVGPTGAVTVSGHAIAEESLP